MSRENFLRRLAALRAKFSDGSNCSPAEIETAMRMYADLKAKYDVEDTEEHIRDEGISSVRGASAMNGKHMDAIAFCINTIAEYTDTKGLLMRHSGGHVMWFGTKPDIEHAMWLYTIIQNGLETAWKAYRYSFEYTKLHRSGAHGRTIRDNFRKGFVANICMRLDKMIAEKKVAGTSLIVVKNELIQAFIDREVGKTKRASGSLTTTNKTSALTAGYNEGEKVGLRQTMKNETLLLEGK